MRAVVSRIEDEGPDAGVHVEIAELGVGYTFGPCELTMPRGDLSVGSRVLVGSIGVPEDVVIIGRLRRF